MRTTAPHLATRRGLPLRRPCPPSASSSAEELVEAPVAVGLVVLLLEGALVELLEAERADKVLRVELPEHGGDATTCNTRALLTIVVVFEKVVSPPVSQLK